jgi:hypothetical protein
MASQNEAEASSSTQMDTSIADVGPSMQADTAATLTLLSSEEMEVAMEDAEEAQRDIAMDEDEEMIDAQWSDEEGDDRPVAGPSR